MYKKKSLLQRLQEDATNKAICILKGHFNDVTSVDFSGRSLLATGSSDKTIRLYKWMPGDSFEELPQSPFKGHRYGVNCIHFSPFGTKLASASTDGQTIIWDVKTGENLFSLQSTPEESPGVRTCSFSPNASLLATGGDDDSVAIWDVSSVSILRQMCGQEWTITCLDFTPDSSYMATGSSNGDLRLWDGRYGQTVPLITKAEIHDLGVTTLHFSPVVGREESIFLSKQYLVATGGQDTDLHLWAVRVGTNVDASKMNESSNVSVNLHHTLCGHKAPIMTVKFNSTGALIASASGDKTVRLWDAMKLVPVAVLEGHRRYATSCAFSDDGLLIAAGGGDRSVHVWRVDDVIKKQNNRNATSAVPLYQFQRESRKLINWSVEDVCCWLGEQGLAEYSPNFRSQAIDGRELLSVSEEVLEDKLGIVALGHRNKLLRLIRKSSKEEDPSIKLPAEYVCPITQETMLDPVLCADGFSYEREAIEAWLTSRKKRSPMTNELLPHLLLTPNRTLRNLIQRHKEENP